MNRVDEILNQSTRRELNRLHGARKVLLEIYARMRPARFNGNELGSVSAQFPVNRHEPRVSNRVSDLSS